MLNQGVADQLQTNYAGDLRHILKSVFEMNSSEPLSLDINGKPSQPHIIPPGHRRANRRRRNHRRHHSTRPRGIELVVITLKLVCSIVMLE